MNSGGRRGRGSVKLLGSLRGEGALAWNGQSLPVRYQLDLYEGQVGRTGNGSLDGPLGPLVDPDADTVAATLRLADGFELAVTLAEIDDQGAMFEAGGDLPDPPR